MRGSGRSPRLSGGALAAVAVLALSGCSGVGGATTADDPADGGGSGEAVTLEMSWWGDDTRAALFDEVITAFEAEHPGVTVTQTPVGAPDDLFNRLATDFAAGGDTAPDVFALGGAKPQEYGSLGALLDLSTVSDQLDTSPFPDFSLTSATVDDTLYAVPTGGNAIAAFVNADVFSAAGVEVPADGWTWDDLLAAATTIGNAGLTNASGQPVYGLDLRVQDILATYEAQLNEVGVYTEDGELGVDAGQVAQWYALEQRMQQAGALPDPSVITSGWALTPDQQLFTLGQAGITFGYSNLASTYSGAGDVQVLLPPTDTDSTGVALLPSAFWAVNATSEHPEEAAELVDWFVNEPAAAELILDTRGVPFNPEILAVVEPKLSGPGKTAAAYVDTVLDSGVVAPPQPAGGAILNELSQRMESDVLFGAKTPQQAGEQWVSEMQAALS